jgi:hypothetical protein
MQVRHHRFGEPPFRSACESQPATFAAKNEKHSLDEVWLGSIRGSKRFIITGILASAGLFIVGWIGFLWLLIWLFPAIL